jgi:hypothetical protein
MTFRAMSPAAPRRQSWLPPLPPPASPWY